MPKTIAENTAVDYDVRGEGPPLILVNGLGFGRWGWFRQVPAFSHHLRTVTFDVRGERGLENGVADLTAEVVALPDHLGMGKAHVLGTSLGTSLGGFVAQRLALDRPDLVDGLVLVCTSYGGRVPRAMSPGALADVVGLGAFGREAAARKALEAATSGAYRAEYPGEFEKIVRWRLADAPSTASHHEQAKAEARFDLSRGVGHITSPTLVIHGSEYRCVPPANARALAEAIPGARLRVLDRAGHLAFIERFADVNREAVRFLKSGDGRAPEAEGGRSGGWLGSALEACAARAKGWTRASWPGALAARSAVPKRVDCSVREKQGPRGGRRRSP